MEVSDADISESDLIEYLDFGDISKIINKYINIFDKNYLIKLKEISNIINLLVPIRNRVVHSRPLLTEDFPILIDNAKILNEISIIKWDKLTETIKLLNTDPTFIFDIKIPEYEFKNERELIYHNLPTPDFDETGLIGREQELRDIKKLIFSHHNVITIVGEGGIGKTATLIQCLYDILDKDEYLFDIIIWVSLKTHVLTVNGIKTIDDAITSTTGLFNKITEELAGNIKTEDYIAEILDYLNEFSILLAIDNLETLNDMTIRNLLTNISGKSKIIITSRIGIGEIEIRYPLYGLKENYAIQLLTLFSKIRQVQNILTLDNKTKKDICDRLNYNPLAIKWFITSVQQGISPQKLLKHEGDLHEFCFSNVYTKLSNESKLVLDTLLVQKKGFSEAEIAYLSDIDIVLFKKAINELFLTNMLKMETKADLNGVLNNVFILNDFAREYLNKYHKPSNARFLEINKRRNLLLAADQEIESQKNRNPYTPKSIMFKTSDERISASFLIKALGVSSDPELSKEKKLKKSIEYIERALELCPSYSEAYRISAFIKANLGDSYGANEDFEAALEIDPNSQTLNYFYAGFLMRYLDDYKKAEIYVDKVIKKDPENVEVQILKARLLTFLSKPNEAHELYSKVLEKKSLYSQKRYVFFVDMYANNLRNWAEIELGERNYKEAELHLMNAIQKIYDLREPRLIDKKLYNRLNQIYTLIINCAIYTKNEKNFTNVIYDYLNKVDIYAKDFVQTGYSIKQILRYEKINGISSELTEKYENFKKHYINFL